MILGGHELISLVVAGGAQVEGVSLFAASVGAKLNVHVNVRLQHIDRLIQLLTVNTVGSTVITVKQRFG